MHCRTATRQRAEDLLRRIASLPVVNWPCNSSRALPLRLWPVANRSRVADRQNAYSQGDEGLEEYTVALPGAVVNLTLANNATSNWYWMSYGLLPHGLGLVLELLHYIVALHRGSGQWNSCKTPVHCLGEAGGGTHAAHIIVA